MRWTQWTAGTIAALLCTAEPIISAQDNAAGRTFDVVSIRLKTIGGGRTSIYDRPDGGLIIANITVSGLVVRAYPPFVPLDTIGLPGWARTNQYDISATSSLPEATAADRMQMLRAMLADRFQLVVHTEHRDTRSYVLKQVHADGRLGPALRRGIDQDCVAYTAAQRADAKATRQSGAQLPDLLKSDSSEPLEPCSVRTVGGKMEGEVPISTMASLLRRFVREPIVDKTGLTGNYHFALEFDPSNGSDPATATLPSIFTAVREQLGLTLDTSVESREVLVIDRVERPTEN